jgi:chromosome segregation ATPase
MGGDVVIELPEPAGKGPSDPRPRLRAKRTVVASGADATEESAIAVTPADAGDPPQLLDALAAAQERLVDVQALIGRAREELLVARAELEAGRQQSVADEERFRAGLAAIRASADDALALEQKAAEELQERLAQGDSEIGQLRQSLERAEAERAGETAEARSQRDQLGTELEATREDAAGVRTRAETAEAAAAQAQTELASVRAQLTTIRDVLEGTP